MPRIMTIWLPRWPVQRRLGERPELRSVPVFVCRRERRGVMTIVAWAWALPPRARSTRGDGRSSAPRIPPGMSLAEGMAVLALAHGSRACHMAEVDSDDPAADRAALERLARQCRRFAPIVALEDAERPECIHLDVTGTAGFFGGEESLVRTAAWTLAAHGVHARVAIADTPGAAWAAAHHAERLGCQPAPPFRRPRRFVVVSPGEQATALAALPAAALRIEADVLAALGEVGIDSIGGALKLSRKSLAARFPPTLARRLSQFMGSRAEPLVPTFGEALPQAAHAYDVPVALREMSEDAIVAVLERLVGQCVAPLAARGEGITALQVRFGQYAGAGRQGPCPPVVIDVGLYRPALAVRHVVELIRLRMARVRMLREIEGIAVEVVAAAPALCRQRNSFLVRALERASRRQRKSACCSTGSAAGSVRRRCSSRNWCAMPSPNMPGWACLRPAEHRARRRLQGRWLRRRSAGRSGSCRGPCCSTWWRSCPPWRMPAGRRCAFGMAARCTTWPRHTVRSASRRPGGAGRSCGATTTWSRRMRGSDCGFFGG